MRIDFTPLHVCTLAAHISVAMTTSKANAQTLGLCSPCSQVIILHRSISHQEGIELFSRQ